jgi:hypothetical protein
MRFSALICATLLALGTTAAMADTMATPTPGAMHSSMMGHMKPKPTMKPHMMSGNHMSGHMMGSPKPKSSMKPN